MQVGKHAPWKCEQAVDHNVHPHRLRWLIFASDDSGECIITILDNYETAALIVHDHNSHAQQQEVIKGLVEALESMQRHVTRKFYLNIIEAALAAAKELK